MEYEFYIYTDNGENTWHWDLKEWKNVKKKDTFRNDKEFFISPSS